MAIYGQKPVGSVAKYVLLPQLLPRISALFFSGFSYFAYFIAQIYLGVRLLPRGHVYLNPQNIGHFSIADVVGAAGKNLKYRKENIDQIIIFYVILLGMGLFCLQALTMLFSLVAPQAMALSLSYYFGDHTGTGIQGAIGGFNASQDIAFILLDRVFGVPGIFDSCVSTAVPCFRATSTLLNSSDIVFTPAVFPWPFHNALHALYEFYSIGLLVIALFIVLYFVVVIVAETAQTGVPFGKRFNSVWAPLRLVIAIGLLVPIGHGLNTAQYVVLYAAKFGSNFGTNGWMVFNSELTSGHMIEGMVAKPQKPEANDLLKFMMLAHACKALEEGYMRYSEKPTAGGGGGTPADCKTTLSATDQTDTIINGYLVKRGSVSAPSYKLLETTSFTDARTFFDNAGMTIRFGDLGCGDAHATQTGNVRPLCGELTLQPVALKETGAVAVQEGYYDLIKHLWGNYSGKVWANNGYCIDSQVNTMLSSGGNQDFKVKSLFYVQKLCPPSYFSTTSGPPALSSMHQELTSEWVNKTLAAYVNGDVCTDPGYFGASPGYVQVPSGLGLIQGVILENIIRRGVFEQIQYMTGSGANDYIMPVDQLSRGWAGAGMWYNHIASVNGALSGSAWETPNISRWPLTQTNIAVQKKMNNQSGTASSANAPNQAGSDTVQSARGPQESTAAGAMYKIDMVWQGASMNLKPKSGNMLFNGLNWLFGTKGLFDLRDPVNQSTHPLALMTGLGKGLVDASIRNLGLAMGGQIAAMGLGDTLGPALEGGSSAFYTFATMTLTAGFILYYVLPFLPFVYFFFAVGNWVKGIFEALVGVPLWALAHIRIDGDGLPGSAALNGYFLIFEIFLRPILIVFGLIAAVSIFAAMAVVFNSVFDLAVYNVGGVDISSTTCGAAVDPNLMSMVRGPIDQFFYTVMYAVVMYIMALASFKLIDLIPNKILRWMGASVDTFGDMAGDPAQSLTSYAAIGGSQMIPSIINSMKSGIGAGGSLVKGMAKMGDG